MTAAALLVAALAALPVAAQPPGDAARGREVFAGKHCARCHRPGGQPGAGPALEQLRRPQGAYALTGRLWNHAPAMFTALTQERLAWPAISVAEMGDLMAYLDADPRRDPAPDLGKGQLALVGKGCLKCHSFRREGGRVGPDLAAQRASYAPPATWAATMWGHTPRMAAAAIQRGVLYPRFSGDEMVNLIGFLKSGAGPAEVTLPPDFPITRAASSPGQVTFSHAKHVAKGATCSACHMRDVKMTRGASGPMTMAALEKGTLCGACHDGKTTLGGTVVFPLDRCDGCHKD